MGGTNSKLSSGSSGHTGVTTPGQTSKKPKDLSAREREERGRGEGDVSDSEEREHGVGVYYEALKRELIKTKTIYGIRCDERLENSI